MKDMKLVTLMAINKPEKKKINEEITVSVGNEPPGVYVGVDDYDDVIFDSQPRIMPSHQLKELIDVLVDISWFRKLVIAAAKRKVRKINLEFTNDGIKFR